MRATWKWGDDAQETQDTVLQRLDELQRWFQGEVAKLDKSAFQFRKADRLGAEAAEDDEGYLFDCFVDNGDLKALCDTNSTCCIVVGRTGMGKTALLLLLKQQQDHVTLLDPDRLALQYLSNSPILRRLAELGVDLDIFYRLLWRHIFAVELVKLKYHLRSEGDQKNFIARITEKFIGDKRKGVALDYLIEWGEHFWQDTEFRIHEVTEKFENDVKRPLGAKASIFSLSAEELGRCSTEDRKEIVHRAQDVVNKVQIRRLSEIIDALADDVFDDVLEHFYVLVDRLDEHWVEDELRYRLIRALVETIRDLRRIRNAKVVIALRQDLLERVFRETRDSGFQEEKYQPLMLPIEWSKQQLLEVLNRRIARLVEHRYTQRSVGWSDVFPPKVGSVETGEYLIIRTMRRPRDIIQFANCCLSKAEDRAQITAGLLRSAEADYSAMRLRSLGDEWVSDYPSLLSAVNLLKRRPPTFPLRNLPLTDVARFMEELIARGEAEKHGRLRHLIRQFFDNQASIEEVRRRLVQVFYKVGVLGIRLEPGSQTAWSFLNPAIRSAEISAEARFGDMPGLPSSPRYCRPCVRDGEQRRRLL